MGSLQHTIPLPQYPNKEFVCKNEKALSSKVLRKVSRPNQLIKIGIIPKSFVGIIISS